MFVAKITLLYPPSERSETGGYTYFCASLCVSVRTQSSLQQCVSLPQRISHPLSERLLVYHSYY